MNLNKIFKNFVLAGILVSAPLYPASIKTPRDLSNWLKNNFTYQWEDEDYWKTPEETVRDKTADCEDFAILSKKVLTDLGHRAYLTILMPKKKNDYGHAICLFREKDKTYSVIDNQYYYPLKYKDWKDILDRFYSNYKKVYNCVDRDHCQKIYTIGEGK